MGQDSDRKNLHNGHRIRLREKFAMAPETFNDYELLELLLFSPIPRTDTNEQAHLLIEKFGSLQGVLEANTDRISAVPGIGPVAAQFLSLVGETARRYAINKIKPKNNKGNTFDSPEKVAAFLAPRFLGLTVERAYLMLFDNGMHLLDCFHIGDGDVSGVPLSMRRIVERAVEKRASAAVLAHNHPGGLCIPSKDDLRITHQLAEALRLLGMPLLDHFIFSDDSYTQVIHPAQQNNSDTHAASPLFDIAVQNRIRKEEDDSTHTGQGGTYGK